LFVFLNLDNLIAIQDEVVGIINDN
jgi:hypothetical protein